MTQSRIYLDHAATSWPKPDGVLDEMHRVGMQCGAAAGRAGYHSAIDADSIVSVARRRVAKLIGADKPHSIAFFSNGTTALNAAIFGVLQQGGHAVTTAAEHNSVLRPLETAKTLFGAEVTIVDCDSNGYVNANNVLNAVTDNTRLVAMTHASNVTGAIQPIAEVGEALIQKKLIFLCDAAQTIGHLPINVNEMRVSMLAAPGHKGCGGPMGTGFLYVDPHLHNVIMPWVVGGSGSQSERLSMPDAMPGRLEAGNLNVPAISGLSLAIKQRPEPDHPNPQERCRELSERLHSGLVAIPGVQMFGRCDQLPIVSLRITSFSPSDVAAILDSSFGIEVRAGLHCAPLIHRCLGSEPDGTLRVSAGVTTTNEHIDRFLAAMREICDTVQNA